MPPLERERGEPISTATTWGGKAGFFENIPQLLEGRAKAAMLGLVPICKTCGDEVPELVTMKVGGKARKVCEDCADRAREEGEVAEQSESVVQQMMGFTGRR